MTNTYNNCVLYITAAVDPYIVHRNRKRFLLSQSTLREEFVEKKYQVFDIIRLLIILVQANLSSAGGASLKVVEFGVSKPQQQHRCGVVCL